MPTKIIRHYKVGVTIVLAMNLLAFGAYAIMSIYSMIRQHEIGCAIGCLTIATFNMIAALLLTELRDAIILILDERENQK